VSWGVNADDDFGCAGLSNAEAVTGRNAAPSEVTATSAIKSLLDMRLRLSFDPRAPLTSDRTDGGGEWDCDGPST